MLELQREIITSRVTCFQMEHNTNEKTLNYEEHYTVIITLSFINHPIKNKKYNPWK